MIDPVGRNSRAAPDLREMSPLRMYFDGLSSQKIVNMKGREQENHWLDFKTLNVSDFSVRSDRETLAAAISGFANADGGILIWGVDARKGEEGVDEVIGTPGVRNPRLAESRLRELAGEATAPVVIGVEHRVISGVKNPSFVATMVPSSDAGPHMAMQGHDGFRYYTRAGGRFAKMHHFQVADMFGRRARPVLDVEAYPNPRGGYAHAMCLRILNRGRGSAQAPFIEINVNRPFVRNEYGVDGNYNDGLPLVRTHQGDGWLHAGGMDSIIHPSMYVDVAGVWLGFGSSYSERVKHLGSNCIINYKVGALGIPPVSGEVRVELSK